MHWVKARYKNEKFLQQVKDLGQHKDQVHLWWLGQSGFLIQWNRVHVLIDPYLSDSLTHKYAGTLKPHTRICEKVIEPAQLSFIDIVSSSHNHTDHLDGETLIPLIEANPGIAFVIPEANREFVCDRINQPLSFPTGLNDGETIVVKDIRFTGIPAAHNLIERDDYGRCRFMGYVVEIGGKKIYHSGDTLLYPGMSELLHPLRIDVAILPINGNDPSRGVAGNLDAGEAAWLAKQIEAGLTIPCHYDMFSFNTADVSEFTGAAEELGIHYRVMELGDSITL